MRKGKREKGKGARETSHRMRLVLAAVLCSLVVMSGAAQTRQPPEPPAGFVPAGDLPQQEQLPAAPLVIAAYAVAWVAVFVYLWSIWQRLARVEKDLVEVSRRITAGERQ